jgi:hypothetical protein
MIFPDARDAVRTSYTEGSPKSSFFVFGLNYSQTKIRKNRSKSRQR